MCWKDTDDVIATASGKIYKGDNIVVDKYDHDNNPWSRHGPVPPDAEAWELSTMAVDPKLQRKGIAKYLMELTEAEIKRTFRRRVEKLKGRGEDPPKRLVMMITTVWEVNGAFYSKRGYRENYETFHPPGTYVRAMTMIETLIIADFMNRQARKASMSNTCLETLIWKICRVRDWCVQLFGPFECLPRLWICTLESRRFQWLRELSDRQEYFQSSRRARRQSFGCGSNARRCIVRSTLLPGPDGG